MSVFNHELQRRDEKEALPFSNFQSAFPRKTPKVRIKETVL